MHHLVPIGDCSTFRHAVQTTFSEQRNTRETEVAAQLLHDLHDLSNKFKMATSMTQTEAQRVASLPVNLIHL